MSSPGTLPPRLLDEVAPPPCRACRVGSDEHPKIYPELHARIPMRTVEDQRAVQEENLKDDERFWDAMRDLNATSADGQKSLIATAEARLKGHERAVADASESLEAAKDRIARLRRGEGVVGSLGKKFDVVAAMKAAGFTQKMIKRAQSLADLAPAEFEVLLERTHAANAVDRALDRELHRLIRAREWTPAARPRSTRSSTTQGARQRNTQKSAERDVRYLKPIGRASAFGPHTVKDTANNAEKTSYPNA